MYSTVDMSKDYYAIEMSYTAKVYTTLCTLTQNNRFLVTTRVGTQWPCTLYNTVCGSNTATAVCAQFGYIPLFAYYEPGCGVSQ